MGWLTKVDPPIENTVLDGIQTILASKPPVEGGSTSSSSSQAPTPAPRFWADAICINQNDMQERTSQVRMMGAIYSQTTLAISWLGADVAGQLEYGFEVMMLIDQELNPRPEASQAADWLAKYPSLLQHDEDSSVLNRAWSSVQAFHQLEYWTRKWIIQEIALPKALLFIAGNSIIPSNVVDASRDFLLGIEKGVILRPKCATKLTWTLFRQQMQENGLFQVSVCMDFRQDYKQDTLLDSSSSYLMMTRTMAFACSNPRDHIFALQGFLKNTQLPDYQKSTREVYCEFAAALVKETDRLHFLRYTGMHRGSSNAFGLPSWVPDWHFLSTNHDDGQRNSHLSADQGIDAFSSRMPLVTTDFTLKFVGVSIDEIDFVTSPGGEGIHFVEFCCQVGKRRNLKDILEVLTDGGKQTEMEHPLDSKESSTTLYVCFLWLLAWDGSNFHFDTVIPALEKVGVMKDGECTPLFYQTFPGLGSSSIWVSRKTWQPLMWDHLDPTKQLTGAYAYSSIVETIGNSLGYTFSPDVRKGDKVCVINGCDFPVLLRQEGSSYSFVGQCYVQGLVDGKAAEMVRNGERMIEQLAIS
jgi:hypothetical protein